MKKRPERTEAAAAVFILIITILLGVFPQILFSPDKWLSDLLCRQKQAAEKNIYIIAVDDKTLNQYGAVTSWSREISADLIEILNSGTARPAVIGLDIIYSEEGIGDPVFAEACKKAGNVVTAMSFQFREMPETDENGKIRYNPFYVDYAVMPYEALAASVRTGFANTILDADGYVRRAALSVDYENRTVYSLAGEVYKSYQESRGEPAEFPKTDENGLFYFTYAGKSGSYNMVSMADVLDGTVDPRLFSDAIVLVGAAAEGLQDAYRPSVSRNRQMFGVEIQANIVEAMLEKKTQLDFPMFPYALGTGVIAVCFFFLVRRLKILPGTAVWLLFSAGNLLFVRGMYLSGYVTQAILPLLVFFLIYAGNLVYGYIAEILKRKRIVNVFKKYVAPQVVDEIARKKDPGIVLGGEVREVAVLFVDIRGFTAMSEKMDPKEVVEILNQYLSLTTNAILKNGGMLDKFVGDAAMGIFNAPFDLEDYIYRAVLAALDMQSGAGRIADQCEERFGKRISFGIGIHCGEAVVGNIGCEFRMDYTAIGDTVNTAARLESRAERGQILVSSAVYEAVRERIKAVSLGQIQLKGKENSVAVYQVFDVPEER